MRSSRAGRVSTTVNAIRELMQKRLESHTLPEEAAHELEMALQTLDMLWEELQEQSNLLDLEHDRYASFFEASPDAYLITDAGGNIREANPAALSLLGAVAGSVVGRQLVRLIPDADQPVFLARFIAVSSGQDDKAVVWLGRLHTPSGPAEVSFSVRRVPLKRSGVGGLCWLIRPT